MPDGVGIAAANKTRDSSRSTNSTHVRAIDDSSFGKRLMDIGSIPIRWRRVDLA
jgi:hypothetical protein